MQCETCSGGESNIQASRSWRKESPGDDGESVGADACGLYWYPWWSMFRRQLRRLLMVFSARDMSCAYSILSDTNSKLAPFRVPYGLP